MIYVSSAGHELIFVKEAIIHSYESQGVRILCNRELICSQWERVDCEQYSIKYRLVSQPLEMDSIQISWRLFPVDHGILYSKEHIEVFAPFSGPISFAISPQIDYSGFQTCKKGFEIEELEKETIYWRDWKGKSFAFSTINGLTWISDLRVRSDTIRYPRNEFGLYQYDWYLQGQ